MILGQEKPHLNEATLAHYGVKGMKWGVRKDQPQTRRSMTPEQKKALATKVAIGAGILTVAAGAAYAGYRLQKDGKLDLSLLQKGVTTVGESVAQKIVDEPTSVMHSGRGKNVGFKILKDGDTKFPFKQLEESGLVGAGLGTNNIRRFGEHGEKVAASLADPKGRRDAAGRPIAHDIIVPASMSAGINTIDDIRTKIWPLLEKDYDQFYSDSEKEAFE